MSVCVCCVLQQAGESWGADASGDWGTEESWESVDGAQGEALRDSVRIMSIRYIFFRCTPGGKESDESFVFSSPQA